MNSPDHDSPASTSSSESPPPEEVAPVTNYLSNLTSHITNIGSLSGPSQAKRRLPPGPSFGAASSDRDHKFRRRERGGGGGGGGGERGEPSRPGHTAWETGKKEPKDDLLDPGLVDYLRKGVQCFRYFSFLSFFLFGMCIQYTYI